MSKIFQFKHFLDVKISSSNYNLFSEKLNKSLEEENFFNNITSKDLEEIFSKITESINYLSTFNEGKQIEEKSLIIKNLIVILSNLLKKNNHYKFYRFKYKNYFLKLIESIFNIKEFSIFFLNEINLLDKNTKNYLLNFLLLNNDLNFKNDNYQNLFLNFVNNVDISKLNFTVKTDIIIIGKMLIHYANNEEKENFYQIIKNIFPEHKRFLNLINKKSIKDFGEKENSIFKYKILLKEYFEKENDFYIMEDNKKKLSNSNYFIENDFFYLNEIKQDIIYNFLKNTKNKKDDFYIFLNNYESEKYIFKKSYNKISINLIYSFLNQYFERKNYSKECFDLYRILKNKYHFPITLNCLNKNYLEHENYQKLILFYSELTGLYCQTENNTYKNYNENDFNFENSLLKKLIISRINNNSFLSKVNNLNYLNLDLNNRYADENKKKYVKEANIFIENIFLEFLKEDKNSFNDLFRKFNFEQDFLMKLFKKYSYLIFKKLNADLDKDNFVLNFLNINHIKNLNYILLFIKKADFDIESYLDGKEIRENFSPYTISNLKKDFEDFKKNSGIDIEKDIELSRYIIQGYSLKESKERIKENINKAIKDLKSLNQSFKGKNIGLHIK